VKRWLTGTIVQVSPASVERQMKPSPLTTTVTPSPWAIPIT